MLKYKNNASTTLSGSINDSQTSITVDNSSGFPVLSGADTFYATMYEESGGSELNIEIVKVTGTTGSVWTIERAQDGTAARSRNGVTTCYIELRVTAATMTELLQSGNNLSDVGSASTARTNLGLGSMATQAADNVAITGGTISGVAITSVDSNTTFQDNADPTKQLKLEINGISTGTTRTLTAPNANGTIALTSDLTGYQPVDADLTAVAGLSAGGLMARTGSGTAAVRAITQPAAGITVTNGDGVSGNPTIGLANDLAAVEGISTTGFVKRTASDTWTAGAIADGDLPSALTGKTYNALSLTAAATGYAIAGGTTSKTLTVSNTLTLAGTDGSTLNIGSGGTLGTGAFATIANYLPLTGGTLSGSLSGTTASFSTSVTTGLHVMSGASPTIRAATSDGADNAVVAISGGGAVDTARGGLLALYGNEHATNGGDVALYAGTGGDLMLKGAGGYFYGNQAAGSVGLTIGNEASNAVDNATRLRFSPAAGFIAAPAVAPYIEAVVENGTTLATNVRFGVYNGSSAVESMRLNSSGVALFNRGMHETKVAVAASAIDLSLGNYFTKTISGATTFTVSNVPASGTVASFILDLTNGGSAAVTWFSGVKWPGGTAPTLTTSGRDVIGFFSHDGGTTWTGLISKDVK